MEKNPNFSGPYELRVHIEFLRKELIDIGLKMGLGHELTIHTSKQLDYLLNEYKKLEI